jgi:hypothetical protein
MNTYIQERLLMSAGLIIGFCTLLPIISAYKFISVIVLTVYRMVTGDVLRFLVMYIILLYGFATAMYVLVHDGAALEPKGMNASPNDVSTCLYMCVYGVYVSVFLYVYTRICSYYVSECDCVCMRVCKSMRCALVQPLWKKPACSLCICAHIHMQEHAHDLNVCAYALCVGAQYEYMRLGLRVRTSNACIVYSVFLKNYFGKQVCT